jgi:hypothetical protein
MRRRPTMFSLALGSFLALAASAAAQQPDNVYETYGAHNPPADSPGCANKDCIYHRAPGEPSNPHFPEYWTSDWIMYRVFNKFADYPPPYPGRPPEPLKEGEDYEVSHGATYYDSSWRGPGGEGAMMEHYEKRCLPIFFFSNHYSCSFISLGDIAYFVTYEDRPKDMPPVCLFSPRNHPPRRNFVEHLPYSLSDSERLNKNVQGYSFWVDAASGKPAQTGVSPVKTNENDIMFGYAFEALARPDAVDHSEKPYRHPQSFYFSGAYNPSCPKQPPQAPFVTQNYTNFAKVRPDPAKTWDLVKNLDPKTLPKCQLFGPPPPCPEKGATLTDAPPPPNWGDIGKARR